MTSGRSTLRGSKPFRLLAGLLLALSLLGIATALSAPPAAASVASAPRVTSSTLGDRVLDEAITKAGHWYVSGGAGPSVFDCSGLVYWAAHAAGINLTQRTTYQMLAGGVHLYRIPLSSIRRGDLVFYGSGHVEINTAWYHTSFGAHHSGTQVGWRPWNSYYEPTMAMRFR